MCRRLFLALLNGASAEITSWDKNQKRMNMKKVGRWEEDGILSRFLCCLIVAWRTTILFRPEIWVKCKLIQAIPDNNYHPTYVYVQQTRREFNKTWMCLHRSPRSSQSTAATQTKDSLSSGCLTLNRCRGGTTAFVQNIPGFIRGLSSGFHKSSEISLFKRTAGRQWCC